MTPLTEIQPEILSLRDEIRRGTKVISLSGLTSISAKSFVLNKLQAETKKTFVIITDSNRELETWENDLVFFQSPIANHQTPILTLPAFESDVYSSLSPHAETLEQRALALWNLSKSQPGFVITSAKSLITRVLPPAEMQKLGAVLKRDEDFPPEDLIEKLAAGGYAWEEPLQSVGDFSVRGGIVDVWSPDAENPVRIEFFGDTVDSIREFDTETQLSINQLKEISLAPMREFSANAKDLKDWAFFARERFADERFARNLKDRTQFADEGETFPGWEFLISLSMQRSASLFDYLKDGVLVIDEPSVIELHLSECYEGFERRFREINEIDEIGLAPDELFLSVEELREKLTRWPRIEIRALGRMAGETDEDFKVNT
jgi:transcription-repair coupling factor (superfamily II helicase)